MIEGTLRVVENYGGIPSIIAVATEGAKPTPDPASNVVGRLCIVEANGLIYRDTGSAWQLVGAVSKATQSQVDTGTDDSTYVTPLTLSTASMLRISRTEVSITGATTLTSSAFNKMHLCSGTSADYTVTLPAASGNAGKVIGFRMANALTKLVTLDGNGSETIDGITTRILWSQESAILQCDGTGWTKVTGRTRPMRCLLRSNVAQSIPNNDLTSASNIPMHVTDIDLGLMADLANSRVVIRRAGTYTVQGKVVYDSGTIASRAAVIVLKNGSTYELQFEGTAYSAGAYPHAAETVIRNYVASDNLILRGFHNTGSARNTLTAFGTHMQPYIYVEEMPTW